MDALRIKSLFEKQKFLPRFRNRRFVRVQDSNNSNYLSPIKYNCRNVQDSLVDYSQGYIMLTGYISSATDTALAAGNVIGLQNGANSVVDTATVRFNNTEIDKNHHVYLTTTIINLLEYSPDYAASFAVQYGFVKDTDTGADATSLTVRNDVIRSAFAAADGNLPARFPVTIKLPLIYLSPFIRRLNFPIMNNLLEIEVEGNFTNCILREDEVQRSKLTVTNSELYLPIVELPAEYESKFLKSQSSSFTKELTWTNFYTYVHSEELQRGAFDIEITSGLPGIRRVLMMAIPEDRWFDQKLSYSTSECAIRNYNVILNGEDFYPQNISTDQEAYNYLTELFSGAGDDLNTGNLLPFTDWKARYRIYGAELARQRVFESDPMKPQSVRIRGNLERGIAGKLRLVVILLQNKTTYIDMVNPYNTKTI